MNLNSILMIVVPIVETATANADLVATISERAEQALIKRYDFYWAVASSVATVLLVVLSFLGFGAWKNIRQGIRDELKNEIRDEMLRSKSLKDEIRLSVQSDLLTEFKQSSDKLGRQIRFSRFQYLANRLDEKGGGISSKDRDALFRSILDLKDDPDITNDAEFAKALEQVLDIFYAHSIWDKFDEIEENLSAVICNSIGIIHTCIYTYGLRILGEIDGDHATISRFNKYLDLADDKKFFEFSLPWRLAWIAAQEPLDERKFQAIVDRISDLNEEELSSYNLSMLRWSDIEKISKNPKSFHRRVVEKFAAALSAIEALGGINIEHSEPDSAISTPILESPRDDQTGEGGKNGNSGNSIPSS